MSWFPPPRSAATAYEEDWAPPPGPAYQQRATFNTVRASLRRSRRRTAGVLVVSYLAYVAMSVFTPTLVAHRVVGSFTVGLLVGCAQIVFAVTIAVRYTTRVGLRVDPLTDAVRAAAQQGQPAEGDTQR